MTNYPALGLPEAWKPLLRGLADAGWELATALDTATLPADCLRALVLVNARDHGYTRSWEGNGEVRPLPCYLSFWNEPEWCGNNLQTGGLTIAALTWEHPMAHGAVANEGLLLTGNWEEDVQEFIGSFFGMSISKSGLNHLIDSD